jgi:hypothetical protein
MEAVQMMAVSPGAGALATILLFAEQQMAEYNTASATSHQHK